MPDFFSAKLHSRGDIDAEISLHATFACLSFFLRARPGLGVDIFYHEPEEMYALAEQLFAAAMKFESMKEESR